MAGAAGWLVTRPTSGRAGRARWHSGVAGSLVLRAGGRTRVDARWPRSGGASLWCVLGMARGERTRFGRLWGPTADSEAEVLNRP